MLIFRGMVGVLLLMAMSGSLLFGQKAAPALTDIAFIAGHWQGKMGSAFIEEVWSPPVGDNMTGMFRLVEEDKLVFSEFMHFEQNEDSVVLKLRHFGKGLIAWEDKENPLHFTLSNVDGDRAVFQQKGTETQLVYHRQSPERLTITLIEVKEGQPHNSVFEFNRQKPE